ncbi:S-adenosyl-L-methionine-dependent methyltransferase [Aspergillus sclerotiicarbonarius CBS 121057]|uniref:S-adenosyl-L-methionine-dependent methyltransferase n=1 Tax=Aspergillus sclerotiicarbonarius (strain CBS 121057 / IBT 28362) TaxID=1448318 RepID=A0A319EXD1_ASPSB|nr:S-adenosyl-L-methionine-dependent methyltransferase [Aspergillus sclerotiicarbonarius CBS 121057]
MSLDKLIKSINSVTEESVNSLSPKKRGALSQACRRVQRMCESPPEKTFRILFAGYQSIVLRLAIDLKLFDAVVERTAANATPNRIGKVTVDQIASDTQAQDVLVARIMRFLSSMGMLKQLNKDTFVTTPLTECYLSDTLLSQAVIYFTHIQSFVARLPDYFRSTKYENPSDKTCPPFQFVVGPTGDYYQYLANNPYYQEAFDPVMKKIWDLYGILWFNLYPVDRKLIMPSDPISSGIFLVDIGGNGQLLRAFCARFPNLPGTVVLQTPPNKAVPRLPAAIKCYPYDYFQPQREQGARVYLLHKVLHQWSDDKARNILERVKDAMKNESVLLIVERVIPEKDVAMLDLVQDLGEMVCHARKERTEREFRDIFSEVGFWVGASWKGKNGEDIELGTKTGMRMVIFEAKLMSAVLYP